jgi:hypothetical protein
MERKKFTIDDVPGGYALCTRDDCTVCNHCLRNIAYKDVVTEKLWSVTQVNPLRVVPNEQCEYFRTDELATYARGFVKMKQEMLPRQYDAFMIKLIGKFGRTGYYERRRGERLCSPKEIEFIRSVLKDLGLPALEFDSYQQRYNWYD